MYSLAVVLYFVSAVTGCAQITSGSYSVVSSGMRAPLQGQKKLGTFKLPVFSNGTFILQELGNQWTIVAMDGWLYQFVIPNLGAPLTSTGKKGDGIMADFSEGKNPTSFSISCAGNNEYVIKHPTEDLVWTNEYEAYPSVSLYSTVKLRPSEGSPSQLYSIINVDF